MSAEEKLARLEREVEALKHEVGRQADAAAVRALQFKYGYYMDKCLFPAIVDLFAPDRRTARGRFRCFMQGGVHETKTDAPPRIPAQFWEAGIYENEYVKEDGVWQIQVFNYRIVYQTKYEHGWAHSGLEPLMVHPYARIFPDDPRGPDELRALPPTWPEVFVMPFHYPHPVTGAVIAPEAK